MKVNQKSLVIESSNLKNLLQKTKQILLKRGKKARSQRGFTWSLNSVLLRWTRSSEDKERYSFWSKKEDGWYQDNFVRKEGAILPEQLASKGGLLFPYTYAQRSRFYDSGWGYGLAVVRAAKSLARRMKDVCGNFANFNSWLSEMSELIHIQTVLSVLIWWKRDLFNYWLNNQDILEKIVKATRVDVLEKIAKEVDEYPLTRRAITPSFMYVTDYLLHPQMGVPPYQAFQLLPGREGSPLSSLHWHRSLDSSGGGQLDFNHDFAWLSFACSKTRRKMGDITILASNLHLYAVSERDIMKDVVPNDDIQSWLARVTDGYKSGKGTAKDLLKKDVYHKNAKMVYSVLGR